MFLRNALVAMIACCASANAAEFTFTATPGTGPAVSYTVTVADGDFDRIVAAYRSIKFPAGVASQPGSRTSVQRDATMQEIVDAIGVDLMAEMNGIVQKELRENAAAAARATVTDIPMTKRR